MTEQSPLERAARALCIAQGDEPDQFSHIGQVPVWKQYVEAARAVLMSVREPSEGMLKGAQCYTNTYFEQSDDDLPTLRQFYVAMIDAALEQPQ